jgi:hypothetical protein
MSEERRPLSRRALLKLAGFAPLPLLGMKLSNSEEDTLESLIANSGLTSGDREKLTRIATTLFTYLKNAAAPVEVMTPAIVAKAYELSAPFVIQNLGEWSDDGDEPNTNSCASLCGYRLRLLAEARGDSQANVEDFESAWIETRDRQASTMVRRRPLLAESAESDRRVALAYGCA